MYQRVWISFVMSNLNSKKFRNPFYIQNPHETFLMYHIYEETYMKIISILLKGLHFISLQGVSFKENNQCYENHIFKRQNWISFINFLYSQNIHQDRYFIQEFQE